MKDDVRHINYGAELTPPSYAQGLDAFLTWVKLWLSCVWPVQIIYDYEIEEVEAYPSYIDNRFQRRVAQKSLPSDRSLRPFRPLLPRGLTRGQFLHRCSRYSIRGRRRFLWIFNWLTHLRRLGQLRICGRIKALNTFADPRLANGGLWAAHLWPG